MVEQNKEETNDNTFENKEELQTNFLTPNLENHFKFLQGLFENGLISVETLDSHFNDIVEKFVSSLNDNNNG